MFAKNNGNKALGNSVQRFSIRKLSIGAASVLIGLAFTSWGTQTVKADDLNPATQPVEEVKNNTTTDNNPSKATVTNTDDQTESTPVQKTTGQSTQTGDDIQINGKPSSNSQPQNGGVKSTLVTTDNNHKVDKQKLEITKTAEVPAQIKEEIKNSKIAKTGVQLRTQSTNPSTTPDKAPTQEGNYNVNDWEGSIDSETHEYTLNKYNGSDKKIYIPNTYDFLKAGKISDNDKVYIDEGLIKTIVNNGAVTITVDSTGDPDKNKVYAKGSWDLALARSKKLEKVDLSHLDTSEITSAGWMLGDDTALTEANVANWSFNNNANLTGLFGGSIGDSKLKRVNMSNMDLRKVENLSSMFENATGLNTIDFQNTKFADNATTSYMFPSLDKLKIQLKGAKNVPKAIFDAFISAVKNSKAETLDLSNISLSSKIKDSNLLSGLSNVKQINVTNFDISHVTDMTNMFSRDTNLTEIKGLSTWNVGNVTSMNSMFDGDTALTNLDLSKWKPLKVTNMAAMFKGCSGLKSITLNWGQNTNNVQNFSEMFANDNNLQTIDGIGEWSVSNATDISHMFACINLDSNPSTNYKYNFAQPQYCGSLTSLDLSNWDTSNVTNMEAVFWGQKSLTTVGNFSQWNTGNVTNMRDLFAGCENLKFNNTALDNLAKWNTSNVTNMRALFANMEKQKDLSCVQNWDTHKVQDMSYMFFQDADLKNVGNLATRGNVWNTSQVGTLSGNLQNYGMSNMFAGCTSLDKIDGINNWDVSHVTKMRFMFYNTALLKSLDLSKWDTSSLQMADKMFFGSGVTDLNLNGWDFSNLKLHADNGMIDNDQNNTIRGSEYMFGNLLHPCTINMTGITLPSQQKETFDVIDFFGADDRPLVVFSPELAQLNLNEESWNFTNKSLLPGEILNSFNKENAKGRQNSNYLTYYRNDDTNKTPIAYQKLNFIFKDKQAQKAQTMALMSLMALPTGQASVGQSPDFDQYLKQVTTIAQIKQLLGPDLAKLWDWKADTKNGSLKEIPGAQPIDQVCAKVGLTFIDGNATQTYTRTIIAKYSDDKPNETLATQTATFSDPYIDNDGNKVWGKHTSWTEFIAPTKAGYDANPASITGVDKPTKDDTAYIMYTKKAVTPDKPVTPPDDNPDQPVTPPDQPDKPSQPITPSDKPETPSNQPNKAHNDNQSEPSTPASNGKYKNAKIKQVRKNKKQKGYERNSGIHGEKASRNKRHLTGVKGQSFGLKHKAAAQNTSTKLNGKATQTKLPQTDAKDNKALSLLGLSLTGITVLLGTIVERKHR